MKITSEYLKQLIKEALEEADLTDLEAVGPEEAYGDDDEQRYVKDMLQGEYDVNMEKVSRLLSDLAGLKSTIDNPQALKQLQIAMSALMEVEKSL
jgi:hypothetical protein